MRAIKRRVARRPERVRDPSFRHAWTGPVLPLGGHPDASQLYFAQGQAEPRRVDHVVLQAHARRLREDRRLHLAIQGHANPGDTPESARALALARAENVRRLLIRFGARASQIEAQAAAPVGSAAQERALNRRAQLRWLDPEHMPAWRSPTLPAEPRVAVAA